MPYSDWPWPLSWLAIALCAVLVFDALRRVDWGTARRDRLIWVLATLGILAARQMAVTLPGGLTLQYLGAAWLCLLQGYPRAVLSMTAIYLFEAAVGLGIGTLAGVGPASLALPLLLLGIVPAWLIWLIVRACRRWLPPNLFVFLLGAGFLGLFVAHAVPLVFTATVDALVTSASATLPGAGASRVALGVHYWQTMLPYAVLLTAGETWLEGMMTTLLVVYLPGAVRLFDEAYYLPAP